MSVFWMIYFIGVITNVVFIVEVALACLVVLIGFKYCNSSNDSDFGWVFKHGRVVGIAASILLIITAVLPNRQTAVLMATTYMVKHAVSQPEMARTQRDLIAYVNARLEKDTYDMQHSGATPNK